MRRASLVTIAMAIGICSLVRGQEQSQVPQEILREFKYLSGSWKFEGRIGDQKTTGTLSARWARGEHCLITQDSTTVGETAPAQSAGVLGWDPVKKKITHCGFASDNTTYLNRWSVTPSGDWAGEVTGTREGKEVTAEFKVTKKSPDEFVFESRDPQGVEIEVIYTRIPNPDKRIEKK